MADEFKAYLSTPQLIVYADEIPSKASSGFGKEVDDQIDKLHLELEANKRFFNGDWTFEEREKTINRIKDRNDILKRAKIKLTPPKDLAEFLEELRNFTHTGFIKREDKIYGNLQSDNNPFIYKEGIGIRGIIGYPSMNREANIRKMVGIKEKFIEKELKTMAIFGVMTKGEVITENRDLTAENNKLYKEALEKTDTNRGLSRKVNTLNQDIEDMKLVHARELKRAKAEAKETLDTDQVKKLNGELEIQKEAFEKHINELKNEIKNKENTAEQLREEVIKHTLENAELAVLKIQNVNLVSQNSFLQQLVQVQISSVVDHANQMHVRSLELIKALPQSTKETTIEKSVEK
jgi:hypothetical protein